MRRTRIAFALALACGVAFALSSPAGAVVTIGQTAPKPGESRCAGFLPFDLVSTSVAAGPSYAVPAGGGVITSWSNMGGVPEGAPQVVGFDVLRRTGYGTFTKVAEDAPREIIPEAPNTFPVEIRAKGGDLIGLNLPSFFEDVESSCVFETENPADELAFAEPGISVGEAEPFTVGDREARTNVSATLVRPPTISSLAPAHGSVTGSKVTINGTEFAKVSGVSFGSVPASSFSVGSEGQITAQAPKSKKPGDVPVTVTTFAGTTGAPATFTYQACKVPKLQGKTLKAASKSLKVAGCKLGKVTKEQGAAPATGKIATQKPKPGTLAAPATKVKLTLVP